MEIVAVLSICYTVHVLLLFFLITILSFINCEDTSRRLRMEVSVDERSIVTSYNLRLTFLSFSHIH